MQLGQHRFAFAGEQRQQHLGIGRGAKHLAHRLELAAQLAKVVDLAIEDNRISPTG